MVKIQTVVAMVCITTLEAVALSQGINGTVFMLVIAALAGLGGYEVGLYKEKPE